MTDLVRTLLGSKNWGDERTSVGDAESVPEALFGLLSAASEEEADGWYWKLDNRVVVQGQLFGAAIALVPALLAGLLMQLAEPARYWLLELMLQIGAGRSHSSEANQDLGLIALDALGEGLWIIYAQLNDSSPRVRATAVDLLSIVDRDPDRMPSLALAHLAGDSSDEVRDAIASLD